MYLNFFQVFFVLFRVLKRRKIKNEVLFSVENACITGEKSTLIFAASIAIYGS